MIAKEITLKKETPDFIFTKFCNYLDDNNKFLSSEIIDNKKIVNCQFDNENDFIDFMKRLENAKL
jgi:hypothetical protein